jgi:hypothetical protein
MHKLPATFHQGEVLATIALELLFSFFVSVAPLLIRFSSASYRLVSHAA